MKEKLKILENLISTLKYKDVCTSWDMCNKTGVCEYNNTTKGCKWYEISEPIKQALQRLESIDNAEPSEALECLDKLAKQIELDEDTDYWEIRNAHKTVEQALLKAQKQEKVLDIIKEKDVDIYILNHCKTVDEYNSKIVHIIGEIRELDPEEFDILKRC